MKSTPFSHSAPLPSLGTSVERVRLNWRKATEACTGTQHVRALLTFGSSYHPVSLYCWKEGQIQCIVSPDSSQPASQADLDMIDACIKHGFIFIFQRSAHEAPIILHGRGLLVSEREDGTDRGQEAQAFSQEESTQRRMGEDTSPIQACTVLPMPTLFVKETPSLLPQSPPKGWPQGERWATAIFLHVLVPLCGGISGYLLTRSPGVGWIAGLLVSILLLGGKGIALYRFWQRGKRVVPLQKDVQKAA